MIEYTSKPEKEIGQAEKILITLFTNINEISKS